MADTVSAAPASTALTAPVQQPTALDAASTGTALVASVARTVRVLRPMVEPAVLLQAQNEVREIIAGLLVEGRDYGVVPGVSKPSLLKPGAEKLNNAYGLVPRFTVIEHEYDHDRKVEWIKRKAVWSGARGQRRKSEEETHGTSYGLYRYVFLCELVDPDGVTRGASWGSASSLESKYVDRPRDVENTVIKIAQKRAFVGATLLALGISEQFTQDVEDVGVAASETSQSMDDHEQPPAEPVPEVGSVLWAQQFVIPEPVKKSCVLVVDTVGQCTNNQLVAIITGCDSLLKRKPDARAVALLKQACEIQQLVLEEDADMAQVGGAPAVADASTPPAPTATDDTPAASPDDPPFNPLAKSPPDDALDAVQARARTADGLDVTDTLPF